MNIAYLNIFSKLLAKYKIAAVNIHGQSFYYQCVFKKVLFQIEYVNMRLLNIKQKKSYKKKHIRAACKSNNIEQKIETPLQRKSAGIINALLAVVHFIILFIMQLPMIF